MTEQTLDRVARALATGMPRRAVMKAAAAAAAGGVLSMIGRHDEALAGQCSPGFRHCGKAGCYSLDPADNHLCCHCTGQLSPMHIFRGEIDQCSDFVADNTICRD
jgi:hypothetical protein